MGISVVKSPCDLWSYQELMFEIKPRLIIETGTLHGGSALWFSDMLSLLHRDNKCCVASIDIAPELYLPRSPLIKYIRGSSISEKVVTSCEYLVEKYQPCMVVLDSDHRANHVYQELGIYSKFVSPGSYMIVEDTNINGHPVLEGWGAGPMEAIKAWLPKHPEFEIDKSRERFLLTMNPDGYLRRKA